MRTGTALDKDIASLIKAGRLPVNPIIRTTLPQVHPQHFRALFDLYSIDSDVQRSVNRHVELALRNGVRFVSENPLAAEALQERLFRMCILTGYIDEQQWLFKVGLDYMLFANLFLYRRFSKANTGLSSTRRSGIVSYDILPPELIAMEFDKNKKISKFTVDSLEYKTSEVVHLAIFQPAGRMFGISPLFSIMHDVHMTRGIEDIVYEMIRKNLHPLLHAKVGVNRPTKVSDREIQDMNVILSSLDPHSGYVVTQGYTELKMIGSESQALRTEGQIDRFRERSLAGLHLPPHKEVEVPFTPSMESRIDTLRRFGFGALESTVFFDLLLEEGFNPILEPKDRVKMLYSPISVERTTKLEMHAQQQYVQGLAGLNEQRLMLGMKPVDDIPAGTREDFFMERERRPMALLGENLNPGAEVSVDE